MEDYVVRGATVAFDGEITFPPPPPKVQAIAAQKPKPVETTPEELAEAEAAAIQKSGIRQTGMLAVGFC